MAVTSDIILENFNIFGWKGNELFSILVHFMYFMYIICKFPYM